MSPALNAYLMVLATLSAVSWAFLPSCIPSKSRPMLEGSVRYMTRGWESIPCVCRYRSSTSTPVSSFIQKWMSRESVPHTSRPVSLRWLMAHWLMPWVRTVFPDPASPLIAIPP